MNSIDTIKINFEEIRRRSIILWSSIPEKHFHWKPDDYAFSIIEMIRLILEGEYWYYKIVEKKGLLDKFESPWENKDFISINDELNFAQPFRNEFLEYINSVSESDLDNIWIARKALNQKES